ncbi:hypothetical protein M3148_06225 [Georgenia satyanarayanai]|uniref:hypothetical protein n=1 Tax=Georgenia satyanarayanai TaxID=860221 RepID=UPI00203B663A|nr:hypothetical protein [Georgenia satyanarayanai]MCM3660591.1 hypothetical protein [Georgenia satyanarayanai]
MTGPREAVALARRLNAAAVAPTATRQVAAVVRTAGAASVLRLGDEMLTRPDGSRLLAGGIRARLAAGDDDAAVRVWLRAVADAQEVVGTTSVPVADAEGGTR